MAAATPSSRSLGLVQELAQWEANFQGKAHSSTGGHPMSLRRATLAVALVLGAGLPAAAETVTPVPAACGTKVPVLAEGESLAETTYYFHSPSAVGDVDGYQTFLGGTSDQRMDTTRPTAATPKVDVNASKSVYPATLPGNPIMSAWYAEFDQEQSMVCMATTYFATGSGDDMAFQLHIDSEFILGTGPVVGTVATGAAIPGGAPVYRYTTTYGQKTKRQPIFFSAFAQIEAASPAGILYDAADYPSSVTIVTVVPAP